MNNNNENELWHIYFPSWLIMAGTYPELFKGMTIKFPLEFVVGYQTYKKTSVSASHNFSGNYIEWDDNNEIYQIAGEVTFAALELSVIEIGGTFAYTTGHVRTSNIEPSIWHPVGTNIIGHAAFQAGFYLYDDIFKNVAGIPPLVYTWEIQKIIQIDSNYSEIEKTDSNNQYLYLLDCIRMPVDPVYDIN